MGDSTLKFFRKFFKDYDLTPNDSGEAFVRCPFPHHAEDGSSYYEENPSAHINVEKALFHCKVCDVGMSEAVFLSKIQDISYKDALVLLGQIDDSEFEEWTQFRENFKNNFAVKNMVAELGFMSVAEELQLGYEGEGVSFPVFVYGELLDVRTYTPNKVPKVKSRQGAKALILPYDLWVNDDRPTLLCAGEKDMAIARANGFNAITFTGGEQSFPRLFKASFRNRDVFIVYDNDEAGKSGSRKMATLLKEAGANPYIVTGHYAVCTEKGEDIHDFFMKYNKSKEDLEAILKETEPFSNADYEEERKKIIPYVSILEAMEGQYHDVKVATPVNVISMYEETFRVPDYVEFEKYEEDKGTMREGEIKEWVLDEDNIKDILLLMDSNLKDKDVRANLYRLAFLAKEKNVKQRIMSRVPVFKAVVTDNREGKGIADDNEHSSEFLVYSVGQKLQAGKNYIIEYKTVTHPLKGQQVVGIVLDARETDSAVEKFKVNEGVIDSLKVFQLDEGQTVKDKMNELYERSKGFIGVEARKEIVFATDLFFHTPLEFMFGNRTERAYLDAMIIGDPRTGKSQASKKLSEMYELGTTTSLKTSTVGGLIGGSDQSGGGWKTKLGLLPRNHKGAVIMEEFSGGGQNIIKKLTEIRSSNRVRITRVNGSLDVPAMVRMLSISNPMSSNDGTSIPLSQYPNGIQVLLDLVGASEDIARYDFFLLVDEPKEYTSPLDAFALEPYDKESYMNRIRWVWSRKPEEVNLSREIMEYIVTKANELNSQYNTHIKLFGAEAWKKLARLAIAVAGMVVSTDDEFCQLIVKKEHVDWAYAFFIRIYDNPIFNLQQYVEVQRRYNHCDDEAIQAVQNLYNNHATMLLELNMSAVMSARQLQAVSGLEQKDYTRVVNQLVRYAFIQYQGDKIVPTPRFREAMKHVTNHYPSKIGEG